MATIIRADAVIILQEGEMLLHNILAPRSFSGNYQGSISLPDAYISVIYFSYYARDYAHVRFSKI